MDYLNPNNSGKKYEDQINLRRAKLEKIRKEREMLQFEKLKRVNQAKQENMDKIRLKFELHDKVQQINDLEIDKIQSEINKLKENAVDNQMIVLEPKISLHNKTLNLKYSNLQITEFPPIITPKYSKHTQTDHSRLYMRNDVSLNKDFEEEDLEYIDEVTPLTLRCRVSSNLPPGILSPGLPIITYIPPALTPIDKENPWNYLKEKNEKILEEKSEKMLISDDFHKSLKRVSLVMEKVISRNKNIYVDYIGGANNDMDRNDKALLKFSHTFCNKNLMENRCITSIDWSTHCAEQIATSFFKNEESILGSGDVTIWNQNFNLQTPQRVFHCHSSVMSVCFTKFNLNLIIGATYSGQIVLWDNRVKSSLPVQCTKLNSKAHTHPIYCLRVIGNDSSHNIISISSDGKLCSWNLEMLGVPLDVMQLQFKISNDVNKPIAVTCMDFPSNGVNNLILGGEDGCAYTAFRYGYNSCINNRYEKHEAPVTSISSHYNQSSSEFGNLFLTSSLDGTIKLWSLESLKPLHTINNNYDYAMDVAWSPVHPSLFVAADGNGCLDLYNLNENIEEPIKSLNTKGQTAINRLKWNDNGQYVAVGTEKGELHLYNVCEDLTNPVNDEWSRFNSILNDIKLNYQIENDETI